MSVVFQIFINFPLGNLRTVGIPFDQFVLVELFVYVFSQRLLDDFIFLQRLECRVQRRWQVFDIFDFTFFFAHLIYILVDRGIEIKFLSDAVESGFQYCCCGKVRIG